MLLIILPLTLSLALTIPSAQNFVAMRAAAVASNALGAKVEVGEVYFSKLNEVELHNLLIEDLRGDTMIVANTVSARISALSLLSQELHISRVELNNGELRLCEVSEGVLNIKEVTDKLINPEGESQFLTHISKIKARGVDFSLKRLAITEEQYGVDLSNIVVNEISAEVTDLNIQGGITQFTIENLEGREQSGLEIVSMQSNFTTYEGVLDFVDMRLTTHDSWLNIPHMRIESDLWEDYSDFEANVALEIVSEGSRLAVSDVAYFSPELEGKSFEAYALSFVANGTVDNLEAQISNLSFGESSSLAAKGAVEGVTEFETAKFSLDVDRITTNGSDVSALIEGFGAEPLSAEMITKLAPLGDFDILAIAKGELSDMSLDATLNSPIGGASYQGTVSVGDRTLVEGVVRSNALEVGRIVGLDLLGATTLVADLSLDLGEGAMNSSVAGEVTSMDYNSCNYSDFIFDLSYDGTIFESAIASHDPKIDFDLSALLDFSPEMQEYDVTLRVSNADLCALALNRRDSLSLLSGSMRINLRGESTENLSGSATVRNLSYSYNDKSIYEPMIAVVARNSENSKYIDLESDFVDITFSSRNTYQGLYNYLHSGLQEYIPILFTDDTERKGESEVTIADDYSTLKVDFKSTDQVADAILSGLNIANNSSVNVMVNPFSERFSLRLKSDYIEHNNLAVTDININASNDKDSLSLYASAADIFLGRNVLTSCSLMAGARNNVVELSTGFRDQASSASATLGLRALFEAKDRAQISLLPSQITLDEEMWLLSAEKIVASGPSLAIDNFALSSGDQRLSLDGVISKSATDSLVLTLDNYDISMLTSVTRDLGYNIDGVSNGYVNISQILDSPRVVASVELDSVSVNKIPSPALKLSAAWSTNDNRAGVYVTNRHTRDTVVTGYYAPSDQRYFAHMKVDSLSAALIDPLLSTTITDTKGFADVDVTLQGREKKASLHGGIDIYDLKTKIIYTQVEYQLPKGRIEVDDNVMSARAQEVFDRDGNRALLTMNLSLDRLSNVSYMMRVVPENLLVLNTTERDNELFYGTVYATGVATIEGDKRGVDMDITATSQPNSSLFMPLSNKSSVVKSDFITFVERSDYDDQANATVNFRRAFMEARERRIEEQNMPNVNITMAVQATPDLDFQLVIDPVVGDIIKAKGEGRLNLAIAPQDNLFEMYGDYNISEGNYLFTLLNPISKRFVIENGSSIQWTGNPLDPILNIDAVYKVKTSLDPLINGTSSSGDYADSESSSTRAVPVDCIIHLGDRLTQPSVKFAIEVPTADTEQQAVISNTLIDQETISQQFFYLMFANSFIPVTTSYGSGLTSTTTASTGFELLTNQLSNWLSSSNYNIIIRYRPESELTSDEIDLGFSRGLIDNRLLIEVEGNYLADNKTAIDDSEFSNWMTDAYITWLIDKAGTLRLKGFTQTIDSYDENQGLQETGIGVYYSESFDTLKELKRKIFDRFRRKKKKSKNNNN